MTLMANRVFDLDTENAFKIGPHIAQVEAQGQQVIKLNLGEPDFNIPDFVKNEIKHQLDKNNTHYCDPKGLLSLRKAIATQISDTRGIKISADQVVVFPGAKPGIGFSQQIYCNPGDEIIYPSPGFPIYESFTRFIGAIPKPLHLQENTGFNFDPQDLLKLISPKTKLIFLNFPSNPTGGVADPEILRATSEIILKQGPKDLRIYSDEIYEKIIFDGKTHSSISSQPGMEKCTIISSGFSKTYAWTGGRLGYAAFPTVEEAEVFKNFNINYFSCVPPYNQEAARLALEHPDAESTIQKMVKTFQDRRDILIEALNKIEGVHCQKPSGAFYVFPNVEGALKKLGVFDFYNTLNHEQQRKTSPSTLFQMFALYHHYVAVMDRRSFGKIGAENQHFLRLSSAQDSQVLLEGVKRLSQAFQDPTGFTNYARTFEKYA